VTTPVNGEMTECIPCDVEQKYGPEEAPDWHAVQPPDENEICGDGLVRRTTRGCHYDLWAGGARVEVKAARWKEHARGGGWYQADVRPSQEFDLLLFCAANGTAHWYVVPCEAVGGRRTISVCSYRPEQSRGWLRRFLERWDVADEVVRSAGAIPFQLELPGVLQ